MRDFPMCRGCRKPIWEDQPKERAASGVWFHVACAPQLSSEWWYHYNMAMQNLMNNQGW